MNVRNNYDPNTVNTADVSLCDNSLHIFYTDGSVVL